MIRTVAATKPKPNPGKNRDISVNGQVWSRYPIKTHVISDTDKMTAIVEKYVKPHVKNHDTLIISERIVAITQGRAYPIDTIKPSQVAKMLVKYVHKSPYGIGLGSPVTMQLAINEAGLLPIMAGALASAITKPFGIKGAFYLTVGKNINAIDGPCSYTLPPYNNYAKLGPSKPNQVAKELSLLLDVDVVIIDANDLGVNILGKSNREQPDLFYQEIFKDNPLGQSKEQTPLCLVRLVK
jgi:F420-0:gamma-glutamyl ligase-like protein